MSVTTAADTRPISACAVLLLGGCSWGWSSVASFPIASVYSKGCGCRLRQEATEHRLTALNHQLPTTAQSPPTKPQGPAPFHRRGRRLPRPPQRRDERGAARGAQRAALPHGGPVEGLHGRAGNKQARWEAGYELGGGGWGVSGGARALGSWSRWRPYRPGEAAGLGHDGEGGTGPWLHTTAAPFRSAPLREVTRGAGLVLVKGWWPCLPCPSVPCLWLAVRLCIHNRFIYIDRAAFEI